MQYQIQTAPIWEAYKTEVGCPLCAIRAEREKRLVKQYLEENVMDPDFRVASNAVGFCADHIRAMYEGRNKLGLALQLETRAAALRKLIDKIPTDKKSAQKQARTIDSHCGCVICSALAEPMSRYTITIAEMYGAEAEFPELFGQANHCLHHSARLMEVAAHAGKKTAVFLNALCSKLCDNLDNAEKVLRAFADCFDFNNAGNKPDPQAISNAIKLLVTDKI